MTGHCVWSGSGAWGLGHRDDTAAYLDPGEGLRGPRPLSTCSEVQKRSRWLLFPD